MLYRNVDSFVKRDDVVWIPNFRAPALRGVIYCLSHRISSYDQRISIVTC
jgi:hypothetical protein